MTVMGVGSGVRLASEVVRKSGGEVVEARVNQCAGPHARAEAERQGRGCVTTLASRARVGPFRAQDVTFGVRLRLTAHPLTNMPI
jgi:hypothetical protein